MSHRKESTKSGKYPNMITHNDERKKQNNFHGISAVRKAVLARKTKYVLLLEEQAG